MGNEEQKGIQVAIEVFNRYEMKYMLDEATFHNLMEVLPEYMICDKYNQEGKFYTIANIYYDTKEDALIRASIEKPVYKEKLRLRSYGMAGLDEEVFLEIKKKYKGIVNKRRTTLHLQEAYDLIELGKIPEITDSVNKQVLQEILYFLKCYPLEPKVYLAYDRLAYFGKKEWDFRITFDTNIRTRRKQVRLEYGTQGEALLPPGKWLMEIKSQTAIPLWFTRLLSEYGIHKTSFSKYGTEYKKHLLEMEERKQKGESVYV